MPRPVKARTAKRRTGTGVDKHDRIVDLADRDMFDIGGLTDEEWSEWRDLRRDHTPTCAACHSWGARMAMPLEHPDGLCKTQPGYCPAKT